MMARFLAFCCVFALGACSTLGDLFAPAAPACEPLTGMTYTVRIKDGQRLGSVEKAATADARCIPPGPGTFSVKVEQKVLCMAADGSSLLVLWEAERGVGAAYRSSTKLPGCLR
jgi:hypothetical protein